jgi:hypothetical protein
MAKWRARKKENVAKAKEKAKEAPGPAFASVEKYQQEWTEEKLRAQFQARLDHVKRRLKKKIISSEQARSEISKIRADLEATKKKKLIYKVSSAPNPEPLRKVRMEKHISGIPKVPEKIPIEIPVHKTAIDELFERLNHEKVN